MGVFGRSWSLMKLSFGIIKQDTEMLLFPLLGGIFSLMYAVALLYPTIVVEILRHDLETASSFTLNAVDYAMLFCTYFGLAFIATFFNVCVVFTTKTRFEGGDATFMDSIRFALSKLHLILTWSLVSASVGLILRGIDSLAERTGAIGALIIKILTAILGAIWSLITIFVVPAMVYEDLGPLDAIKRSTQTLKATWGESLIRHYGLGMMQLIFALLGVGLCMGLFVLLEPLGSTGTIITLWVGVVYFIGLVLIFQVANTVFNTALYAFARTGRAPAGFDGHALAGALGPKSSGGIFS